MKLKTIRWIGGPTLEQPDSFNPSFPRRVEYVTKFRDILDTKVPLFGRALRILRFTLPGEKPGLSKLLKKSMLHNILLSFGRVAMAICVLQQQWESLILLWLGEMHGT